MCIPGFSTAGASLASRFVSSRTGGLNRRGDVACSPGMNATEILGACPSSRRRLAQNAVVMISSIVDASGFGVSVELRYVAFTAPRVSSRCATILAAGYDGPVIYQPALMKTVT